MLWALPRWLWTLLAAAVDVVDHVETRGVSVVGGSGLYGVLATCLGLRRTYAVQYRGLPLEV